MVFIITKTRPFNIMTLLMAAKTKSFRWKNVIFLLLFIETGIVGTRYNRLIEAALTGTHNLCFIAEIRKIMYTPANPIFVYLKVGFEGIRFT